MPRSLGLSLLKEGAITPAQLVDAHRSGTDEPLAQRLFARGAASQAQIAGSLAKLQDAKDPFAWPQLRPAWR